MVPLRFRPFLMRWTDFWLKFDNEKLFHWFGTVAESTLGHTYRDWSDPRHDQRFLCPQIPGANSMKSSALTLFSVLYRNGSIINEVRSLRCLTHELVYVDLPVLLGLGALRCSACVWLQFEPYRDIYILANMPYARCTHVANYWRHVYILFRIN